MRRKGRAELLVPPGQRVEALRRGGDHADARVVGQAAALDESRGVHLVDESGHAGLCHAAEGREVAEALGAVVAQEGQRAPLRGGGVGLGVESRDAGEGVHREQKRLQVVVAGHM